MMNDFAQYFPIWDKLTSEQQNRIFSVTDMHCIKAGTVIHDGSPDCLGMILVRNGQLRAACFPLPASCPICSSIFLLRRRKIVKSG